MSKADFYHTPKKARKIYAPRRHRPIETPPPVEQGRDKPERRRPHWLPWPVHGTAAGR